MSSVSSDSTEIGRPQEAINEFWENLITKKPTKVTKVFPSSLYAHLLPPPHEPGTVTGKNAAESYQAAASECRARVKRIVRECHRTNEKFTDPDFDIENLGDKNCLEGLLYWYKERPVPSTSSVSPSRLGDALSTLIQSDVLAQNAAVFDFAAAAKLLDPNGSDDENGGPGSVHRVDWIFDKPQFEIDGFTSSDLVQGSNGDCWFIAATATVCSHPDLINKVCVERDEECGVYGFVFYRDGIWIWTVVDDNLYLNYSDFDAYGDRYDPTGAKETRYKKNNQTGSEALYFASCADENETWLPLLEKAYAKVHGDYDAIAGGYSGEAVEDLTGGVTTKILTDRILSRERLWKELLQVNKQFLFSASSPGSYGDDSDARRGLALSHAYSVIKVVEEEDEEGKKHKLVLIRNPWGKRANAAMGEWTGPWSDGSSQWTSYWIEKLNHKFGDDGLFWMSYEDLLKRFQLLDRTRLFDQEWTVVQHWTSVSVAWVTGYLNTKFQVTIKKAGPTVFVLCQLDDRYFRGLEGKYNFDLHFILQNENAKAGDHIIRARGAWFGNRSISAEADLEIGTYEVLPKIEASRDADAADVHEVVTKVAERNPQKLRQIGMNYDIANAKGITDTSDEQKKKREQKKKEAAEKKKKEKEDEEKNKIAFEAWKKEEMAEYEAWKKEKKAREDKEKSQQGASKDESGDRVAKKEEADTVAAAHIAESISTQKDEAADTSTTSAEQAKPAVVVDLTIRAKDSESKNDSNEKSDEPKFQFDEASDDDDAAPRYRGPPAPASVASYAYGNRYPGSAYGEAPAPNPHANPRPVADKGPKPWNAVCVLGLRVYSRDPEVSIKLVKPKDLEEGAILDIDGDTAAGATM
ncbi:cysteine proteinase [Cucurbitaria berberidis CBS 394.84]|uniref:Cysteine proteinase n=1 Tax=Cucurbitaria berberidis CBS 394.84 TaxID=1168544 RepID=A0A9P4LDR1_9PLEO|nr:cysteine proteinase [Cucurbitaria berberidis CBS 394.84]KAF1850642.1 cysteine proteinase [Cucurbitaria berberidis CBS 394.84]